MKRRASYEPISIGMTAPATTMMPGGLGGGAVLGAHAARGGGQAAWGVLRPALAGAGTAGARAAQSYGDRVKGAVSNVGSRLGGVVRQWIRNVAMSVGGPGGKAIQT